MSRRYEVGEVVQVIRRGGPTDARIVRPGIAGLRYGPELAAYVLWVKSRKAWTKHAHPLYAIELYPAPQPKENPHVTPAAPSPPAGETPPAPVPMGIGQEHAEAVRRATDTLLHGDYLLKVHMQRDRRLCREVAHAIETREPTPEWLREWERLKQAWRDALSDLHNAIGEDAEDDRELEEAASAAEAALDAHVGIRASVGAESEGEDG